MDTSAKNHVLHLLAERLDRRRERILQANRDDLAAADSLDPALADRLTVDTGKVDAMIHAVRQAIGLEDPVGRVLHRHLHENGLVIENRVVPFGRILIIYESRPDVTVEAAVVAFKAGNRILLKGGREAHGTNRVLVGCWHEALLEAGLDTDWVEYLDLDREATRAFIRSETNGVDLVIPRGGEALIGFVREHSRAPVIVSGRGNNFLYVHEKADPEMARRIALNGKSRVSVCNALDKVLVDRRLPELGPWMRDTAEAFAEMGVQVLADPETAALAGIAESVAGEALEALMPEEFLAPKVLVRLVGGLDEAVTWVNRWSGGHSAAVVTREEPTAHAFMERVDCAAVYHNASTRFTDGGQFGFGAEMAISTQKLHFRGPIGMGQLVSNKWFVTGEGQVR